MGSCTLSALWLRFLKRLSEKALRRQSIEEEIRKQIKLLLLRKSVLIKLIILYYLRFEYLLLDHLHHL